VPEGVEPEKPRRKREPSQAAIDLLKTLLRLRSEEADVAPRLIANAEDIDNLAAFEDDGVDALHGWRAEVFGNDAIALRNGELGIALSKGRAVVVKLNGVTD
jgi:ribonuclease D